MFILSQNKRNLAECGKIYVTKNYGGKKGEKAALFGVEKRIFGTFSSSIILGMYEGQEEAMAELEKIYEAMKNRDTVYAVK